MCTHGTLQTHHSSNLPFVRHPAGRPKSPPVKPETSASLGGTAPNMTHHDNSELGRVSHGTLHIPWDVVELRVPNAKKNMRNQGGKEEKNMVNSTMEVKSAGTTAIFQTKEITSINQFELTGMVNYINTPGK